MPRGPAGGGSLTAATSIKSPFCARCPLILPLGLSVRLFVPSTHHQIQLSIIMVVTARRIQKLGTSASRATSTSSPAQRARTVAIALKTLPGTSQPHSQFTAGAESQVVRALHTTPVTQLQGNATRNKENIAWAAKGNIKYQELKPITESPSGVSQGRAEGAKIADVLCTDSERRRPFPCPIPFFLTQLGPRRPGYRKSPSLTCESHWRHHRA